MKFTCDKMDLCNAITHVMKAVALKSTVPVMEGICIQMQKEQITLTGYNLEMGIRTTVPAKCDEEFTFVLLGRLFTEMIRRMPGVEITCEIQENFSVIISSEDTHYQLSAMSAEEFPDLPVVESMATVTISQQLLKSMLQESGYAVAVRDDMPILTGELFESKNGIFYIVAMDRFRLALRQEQIPNLPEFRFVVPKKALNEVVSMLKDDKDDNEQSCVFSVSERHIVFSVNGFELFARLLEGDYPDFHRNIPTEIKTIVQVPKKELMACVERCSLLINEKNRAPMQCTFENGILEISCKTAIGAIRDRLPVDIDGESLTIGFSNKYLMDALRSCQCEKLSFQLGGSYKVIKITPTENESFIYLIMPIQLRD